MNSRETDSETTKKTLGGRIGPLHRIPGVDVQATREFINIAALTLEPEDRTQRQAFKALMPDLYILRNKGFSFQQLASMLTSAGFSLQPATVRNYFNEMLVDREEECIKRMNEQLIILEEVNKATRNADMSSYADKVSAIIGRQRGHVGPKVDHLLEINGGVTAVPPSPPVTLVSGSEAIAGKSEVAAPPPREKNDPAGTAAGSVAAPTGAASDNGLGFGLAASVNATPAASFKASQPAFFDMGEPVVPDLSSSSSNDLESKNNRVLKCLPLRGDVKPLDRRAGVPDEVYTDAELEHPAIPGLMLTKDARLFSAYLEYSDSDGEVHIETAKEKQFRIMWKKPIPSTKSSTSHTFVEMNMANFKTKS